MRRGGAYRHLSALENRNAVNVADGRALGTSVTWSDAHTRVSLYSIQILTLLSHILTALHGKPR
jgi:hypothetical protein